MSENPCVAGSIPALPSVLSLPKALERANALRTTPQNTCGKLVVRNAEAAGEREASPPASDAMPEYPIEKLAIAAGRIEGRSSVTFPWRGFVANDGQYGYWVQGASKRPKVLADVREPLLEVGCVHTDLVFVYFLLLGDELIYIGQTRNLSNRLNAHRNAEKRVFDRVFYVIAPPDQADSLEYIYIEKLKPTQNVRLGNSHGRKRRTKAVEE